MKRTLFSLKTEAFPNCFPQDDELGWWIFWRKAREVMCRFHHVMSREPAVPVTCYCWCAHWWHVLCRIFQVYPLQSCSLLIPLSSGRPQRKSLRAANMSGGEGYAPPAGGQSIYIYCLEFFCMGNLSIPPIHLFIALFTHMGVDWWIRYECLFGNRRLRKKQTLRNT